MTPTSPTAANLDPWSDPRLTGESWAIAHGKYTEGAAFVAIGMRLMGRPCTDDGCDLGAPCGRHRRATAVAQRYLRMRSGQ
jgi:hypothetical protein